MEGRQLEGKKEESLEEIEEGREGGGMEGNEPLGSSVISSAETCPNRSLRERERDRYQLEGSNGEV